MSAGTGGFSGSANAKGPVAGFDPVMKFRKKFKKKKEIKETTTCPRDSQVPSKLFQYKVNVPEVGETVVYANSPAELRMKMRMLIMPKYRSGIDIERIMPGAAAKFLSPASSCAIMAASRPAGALTVVGGWASLSGCTVRPMPRPGTTSAQTSSPTFSIASMNCTLSLRAARIQTTTMAARAQNSTGRTRAARGRRAQIATAAAC